MRSDVVVRPAHLLSAAQQALTTFDLDLADSLATSARYLDGGAPADQAMAEVLVRRGRYEHAAGVLPDQPPADAPVGERTRWAVTMAAIHYWGAGDVGAAERVLAEVGGPVAEAHRSGFVLLDGRPADALTIASAVVRGPGVPEEAVAPAVSTMVVAASLTGRFDQVGAAGRTEFVQVEYVRCFALLMASRIGEAARMAAAGYRHAAATHNLAAVGGWSVLRGLLAKTHGDPAGAVAALELAARLLDGRDTCRMLALCHAELATAHALAGNRARAEATLRAAPPGDRLFAPWFGLSRAWTAATGGDTTTAARLATDAADLAAAGGQFAVEAVARYDVARLGDPKSVCGRLAELAGIVRGPLVPAMAAAASALATADATALDRTTTIYTGLGQDLLAAETARAAAALHRRPNLAAAAAARASTCPTAATPLLRLARTVVGLTRRERDVAGLAAAGLTSQTIADRLRLSVRTVDNHLGRVYQKLGVTNRRELTPALRPLP